MEGGIVASGRVALFQVEVFRRIFLPKPFAGQAHLAVVGMFGQPAIRGGPGTCDFGRGFAVGRQIHNLPTIAPLVTFFRLFTCS